VGFVTSIIFFMFIFEICSYKKINQHGLSCTTLQFILFKLKLASQISGYELILLCIQTVGSID
jgi:hypothetical protein